MSNQLPQNVITKCRRRNGKVHITIEYDLDEDKWYGKDEMAVRLQYTSSWLLKHLCIWADFDHCYSMELFIDSLKALSTGLLRWNNCITSKRNGHRCLTAARQLEIAYADDSCIAKNYQNWSKRYKIGWKSYKGGFVEIIRTELCSNAMEMDAKEYSNKMWHLIYNKRKILEKTRKDEAWAYLRKYLEHFWD